jgi:hypothetical protein
LPVVVVAMEVVVMLGLLGLLGLLMLLPPSHRLTRRLLEMLLAW